MRSDRVSFFCLCCLDVLFLAFVRSGYVNLGGGNINNVGNNGYGWSSTAISTSLAYRWRWTPTSVSTEGDPSRFYGFPSAEVLPVRCRSLR